MFIQSILDLFGFATETSYNFLTQDLTAFAPSVALAMENINNGLQAFSYALLVILTLWNVVRTAGSYVELKRPEHVFKLFVRFILSKYAIGVAWKLVNGIFAIIGFIVAVVLSVTLLLTVIGRFFKIYLFAAMSPIPLATFGSESTHSIGQNFLKSFAGVSLEGLTVGLALIVFSAYCQSPVMDLSGLGIFQWIGDAAEEMAYMYSLIFNMLLLLGIIKGADQVTHKIFGM